MKTLVLVFTLAVTVGIDAMAQTPSGTIPINLTIINQFTGKPVDADLTWYDPSLVKRLGVGKYQLQLGNDLEKTLTVTRAGYFDFEMKMDYATVKATPDHEIKFQPSIPHLNISILSDETGETISSAIDLFTIDESSVVFSEEVEISPYTIDLEYDKVHVLQVRSPGFFSFKDTIDYKGVFEGRKRTRTIRLVPLKAGNKISLNNIYFKENEATLTDFAKLMLVELTHVLEQQRSLVIEVGAYTDDLGSDQYNIDLSLKRATSVKNYLVEKGADAKQLLTKGYGEVSPVAPNTTDANRALNRRVEFKIVRVQ
jgi:outer membrane protein OmpA-like peptidoglycan-associated protein